MTSNSVALNPLIDIPELTRLPKNVVPKRYELKLDIDPKEKVYSGSVNIRIFFNAKETQTVWLHSVDNDILSASIRFSQCTYSYESKKIIYVPDKGCIGIHFEKPIHEGTRAWLSIEFSGAISQNLEGFFSTPYINEYGDVCLGATTMFAPTEARTCFPCFDEPDFKAIFALEITVDDHLMVLSNMPIKESTLINEGGRQRRTDIFDWTKEMSTYLVCFVIGEYDYLETESGKTSIRVYTPCGQKQEGKYALDVAKKSLDFFNDYFGKEYPLPKLDLIAVSRLSVGAMENWGVIVCRESGLIINSEEASLASLQSVSTLIAHEISHQWFGNLVTMKWWDGLYLNEGFATLMQYICIDHIFPHYEVFNLFSADTVLPALSMDSLQNTHPIEMPITNTKEISQVFDKITYCKGASVIFMLHEYIGKQTFKEAIQVYMDHFSYNNATTKDLWHHLSSVCNIDVASMMNNWIHEIGFPLIHACYVKRNGKSFLSLTQSSFAGDAQKNNLTIWDVPLKGIYTDRFGTLHNFEILFGELRTEIELYDFDIKHPKCWLKLNPKLTGFYRVYYCSAFFDSLLQNLHNEHLFPIDRVGLFDDQIALVLCEDGSTVRLLKMIQLFKEFEISATVWKRVCLTLNQIRILTWPSEEIANMLDQFCLETLRPVLNRIGYTPKENETSNEKALRSTVFSFLVSLKDEKTLQIAKDMFHDHVEKFVPMPSGLREVMYRAVMVSANQQTLDDMITLYKNSDFAEERASILQAMGSAQDPEILSQVLAFALSSDVHAQEAIPVIVAASVNRYGYKMTWEFFVKHLDQILSRYIRTLFLFTKLIKSVTQYVCEEECFHKVNMFFITNQSKFGGSKYAIKQAVEHMELHVIWRNKDITHLHQFLTSYTTNS